MKKVLFAGIIGVTSLLASQALAATTFLFTDNPVGGNGLVDNPYIFEDTDPATNTTIAVRAFRQLKPEYSGDPSVPVFRKSQVGFYGYHGLGADSGSYYDRHTIDNHSYYRDMLVLEVGSPNWTPLEFTFNYFDGPRDIQISWTKKRNCRYYYWCWKPEITQTNDDDVDIFAFGGGQLDFGDANFENSLETLVSSQNLLGSFEDAPIDEDALNTTGLFQYFVVAAPLLGHDDDFKLTSFTGQLSTVPVPAALPLLVSGLIGIGFLGRSRKKAA